MMPSQRDDDTSVRPTPLHIPRPCGGDTCC